MTLIHTIPPLPPSLSPALEAFAVRLESRDDGAWQTLLSQVNPVFGDPIAAQVAHLMKTYNADGEYDGELIRKMLSEKDDLAATASAELEGVAGVSPEDDVAEEIYGNEPSDSEDEEDHAEDNPVRTSLGCDMCEPYGTPGQMYACDDCSIPCPGCSGGYDEEDYQMAYEMAQPRFLNGLSKERLVELILMTEEQRDDALYKGTMAMVDAE